MNFNRIGVIYRKELVDTLRDRRTIISTIVIPILMFPVLTLGFGFLASRSMQKVQQEASPIMLLGETNAPALAATIRDAEGIKVVPSDQNYAAWIGAKKLRAAVEFPPNFERDVGKSAGKAPHVTIYNFAGEMRSQVAVRNLQKILGDYRRRLVEASLAENGLASEVLRPFESSEVNVAAPEKVGGNVVGGLFPYMIIFLCFMGALAPARRNAGPSKRSWPVP